MFLGRRGANFEPIKAHPNSLREKLAYGSSSKIAQISRNGRTQTNKKTNSFKLMGNGNG
jgi:hypothetical protein